MADKAKDDGRVDLKVRVPRELDRELEITAVTRGFTKRQMVEDGVRMILRKIARSAA